MAVAPPVERTPHPTGHALTAASTVSRLEWSARGDHFALPAAADEMSRAVEYGEAAIGYSGLTRLQQPSIKALAKTKPNVNYRPTRPPRFIQIDGRFIQIVAL